jgi:EEF1A N-terminal glycine/lysine methyltransferase
MMAFATADRTNCHVVGTALPSIISIFAGASEVCITDHPSSPALAFGAIQSNVQESLELAEKRNQSLLFSIEKHEWGSVTDVFAHENCNHYTRVIAADCLWMPSQHHNLVRSITHFLSKQSPEACALVVAGFHTGRSIVADFLKQFPTLIGMGDTREKLVVADVYESNMNGARRPWQGNRADEDKEELKRWCVVAVIVRRE